MKKRVYISAVLLMALMSSVSCRKVYQCSCTYNNNIVFTKHLGNQVLEKAEEECSSYDTTVTGEMWTCTVY